MQKSYSIGLILLIYFTIKYKNVVFELLAKADPAPRLEKFYISFQYVYYHNFNKTTFYM